MEYHPSLCPTGLQSQKTKQIIGATPLMVRPESRVGPTLTSVQKENISSESRQLVSVGQVPSQLEGAEL